MVKGRWAAILVAITGLAILVGLFQFNQQHSVDDQYLVVNIATLLWLPMMLIFLVFREDPSGYGFGVGDPKIGYRWAGILFLLLLPFMIYASHEPNYQKYYPMGVGAMTGVSAFWRFELLYGVYLFCWEFFFRGYLLFGLRKSLGSWSVLAQAIPFGIMHCGKPEFAGSFVSGLILGILAMRSKSFMPCFILHWAISVTFDILVITARPIHFF